MAIVGAGAAGLACAIFTKEGQPRLRVALFDGAARPGAKILVSGGTRCNVTNTVVSEADFNGGRSTIIQRVLRALPVPETVAFFKRIGVPLHEEEGGKLFPDSNRARDVLAALLGASSRAGVEHRFGQRVLDVVTEDGGFRVKAAAEDLRARALVLATGGLSLPKTGSDGWGYDLARRLGHRIVQTTPALVPLVLDSDAGAAPHRELAGVSQPVRLDLRVNGAIRTRVTGSLLWTHFGVSGPAVLDLSRHWLRAALDGHQVGVTASFCPEATFGSMEEWWLDLARRRPRLGAETTVAGRVPARVAAVALRRAGVAPGLTLAGLTREDRRRLTHLLLEWPLPVTGSRGYNFAEVTAGGVALDEVDPATMASRVCPGLYLVGEVLDVDGRIGGFNFQWAWSSAWVAAGGLLRTSN